MASFHLHTSLHILHKQLWGFDRGIWICFRKICYFHCLNLTREMLMRLVSKSAAVLMPARSRQVLLAPTHTCTGLPDHVLLTSDKPEIIISRVSTHEVYNLQPWLLFILLPDHFLGLSLKGELCESCRKQSYCSVLTSGFLTFPPSEEKSLEGGQLHLDVQCSTPQEAYPSVCSSRVTVGDLRGDQGGLRLQALRPWMRGAASLGCLKFWQLCQQTIQAH